MAPAKKFDALREHYRPVVNIAVRQTIMAMGRHALPVHHSTELPPPVLQAAHPYHRAVLHLAQHILFQIPPAVEPQQSLQHAVPVKKAKQGIQTKNRQTAVLLIRRTRCLSP